jgi:hypothetical protein
MAEEKLVPAGRTSVPWTCSAPDGFSGMETCGELLSRIGSDSVVAVATGCLFVRLLTTASVAN